MVLRSLAALAVPLVLLVSCTNDDPDPILAPSASPTPTSDEPSPTETASEDPESPEEFIERWNDLSTEMQNTGETDAYLELSSRCDACVAVAERVDSYFAAGGFVKTKGWTLNGVERSGPASRPTMTLDVTSSPTSYREATGSRLKRFDGGAYTYELSLATDDNEWAVTSLVEVSQP